MIEFGVSISLDNDIGRNQSWQQPVARIERLPWITNIHSRAGKGSTVYDAVDWYLVDDFWINAVKAAENPIGE